MAVASMIFVDTGAWIARLVARDQNHERALEAWAVLARGQQRCATSNYVLDECITLLARKTTYAFAAREARKLYASDRLEVLRPAAIDERAAIELFAKYADQRVSFTDCVSFALMKRHRMRRAFAFDRHFAAAGFELWPP
jgi:predicted nucleic acid-binding protein